MKIWKCAALFLCSAFNVATYAASFNSDKARTQTEHAICEYRAVNDADV